MVTVNTILYSIPNCSEMSFFGAKTIGDAHSDFTGSITFMRSILSISASLNSLIFGPGILHGVESGYARCGQFDEVFGHLNAAQNDCPTFHEVCKRVQNFLMVLNVLYTNIQVALLVCIQLIIIIIYGLDFSVSMYLVMS